MPADKKINKSTLMQQPSLVLQIVNRYLRWIVTILIGATLFAGYVFVIERKITVVRDVAQQSLQSKEALLNFLESVKKELDGVIIDFGSIRTSQKIVFDRFDQLLPRESQYGDLYTMFDDIAKKAGMKIVSINFAFVDDAGSGQAKFIAVKPGAGAPVGSAPAAGLPAAVRPVMVNLAVEGGSYETLKTYLGLLERNIRLFDIKSISFDGGAFVTSTNGTPGSAHYDIELTTYYQPDQYAK